MTKVSVEYAHIYTNQHISEEHRVSVDILTSVKQKLEADGKELSLVVMVDDYSFPDPSFNYDQFTEWLGDQGFKPDILFRESQLIPVCDEVVSLIENEKLKSQIIDYVKAKKYPCSLFIASWYLIRLGKIALPSFPTGLVADGLINILPESFKPFEDKGLEIIASTIHRDCVENIQYEFLQGRLIA